jgi:hypothetical protein
MNNLKVSEAILVYSVRPEVLNLREDREREREREGERYVEIGTSKR